MEYYRGSISSLRSFCRYTSHASPLSTRTLSRDIGDESLGFTLQAVIILNLARAAKVELSLCVAKGFPDMALWHSRNQSPIFLSWKIWFRPVAPYWDHRTPHRANIPAQIPIRCLSFPNHINSSPIHLPSNSQYPHLRSPDIMGRAMDRQISNPLSSHNFSPKPYLSVYPSPLPGKKTIYTFYCERCGKDLEHGPPVICGACGVSIDVPGSEARMGRTDGR